MTCPICKHPGSKDAASCSFAYRHPKPSPLAIGSGLDRLTSYILRSATIYCVGAWSGVTVAEDMVRCAGITRADIRKFTNDPHERKKLYALLRPNSPAQPPKVG